MPKLICTNPDGATYKRKTFVYRQVIHVNAWWARCAKEDMPESFALYYKGLEDELPDPEPKRKRAGKEAEASGNAEKA